MELPRFLHGQICNLCEDGVESIFCDAVNWDDGYLAFVRALLKQAVGEPCVAQLQLALCLDWLLSAVPAWMLTFGAANNQGCTASAGLEVFKVSLCSQPHEVAPRTMLLAMCHNFVTVDLACSILQCICWLCVMPQPSSVATATGQVLLHI